MLEKPDVRDQSIIVALEDQYDLRIAKLFFLPIGADMNAAAYRVVGHDNMAYFLKLRRILDETVIRVPLFLRSQGIQEIIAPIENNSKRGFADVGEYKMILYPFIEGKNGFETDLSDYQKRRLGSALKAIHSIDVPSDLKDIIPRETFSPRYREGMKAFLKQVDSQAFEGVADKLASFIRSKRNEIDDLIECSQELAYKLQARPLELVLCHTDIHGGNILVSDDDEIYIVDWDAPIFAPKERDLMFIGGGIDALWKTKQDEALFYDGYGKTVVDLTALAYYRHERIIVDLVEICNQLLLSDRGGTDREQAYRWFIANFAPGQTLDIAKKSTSS